MTGLLGPDDAGFEEPVKAMDFRTIALLLGMMVVVGCLREGGFFERLGGLLDGHVRNPTALWPWSWRRPASCRRCWSTTWFAWRSSPLVLHTTRRLRLDPRPHLVGLALASNVGSTATPTGNPQNVIIADLSRISYLRFVEPSAPSRSVAWRPLSC